MLATTTPERSSRDRVRTLVPVSGGSFDKDAAGHWDRRPRRLLDGSQRSTRTQLAHEPAPVGAERDGRGVVERSTLRLRRVGTAPWGQEVPLSGHGLWPARAPKPVPRVLRSLVMRRSRSERRVASFHVKHRVGTEREAHADANEEPDAWLRHHDELSGLAAGASRTTRVDQLAPDLHR